AGIQRKLVRKALDVCIKSGYLHCVRWGRPKGPGDNGLSSLFELKWDEQSEYTTNLENFFGFFAHEGNRTYIPNQFFDVVVPYENLSVIKVVGAIIRHTIGFQNRYGFRRQQVQMSVTDLERLTGMGRQAIRLGLKRAVEANYLIRIKDGRFD